MIKRTLGQTGVEAAPLGFGCMRLPLADPADNAKIDYDLARDMLRKAVDGGVNYVDTAWPYHGDGGRMNPGESEPFVAWALKDGYREKVQLATKLPSWTIQNQKQMHHCLDRQLKRLDTACLDFYLLHNLSTAVWPYLKDIGALKFLDEAMKDGRIKYPGFSFHDSYEVFEQIINDYDWAVAQIQYNYIDVNYQAGRKGLELAAAKKIGVIVMEPLRGGFLISFMPDEMKELLHSVRPEWSLADWSFRWLWQQPEVGVVLSGMSAMEQVEENLSIAEKGPAEPMTEKDQEALTEVREFFEARLKLNCTGCGYCLPCPSGVNIPKNFSFYNQYYLMDSDVVRSRTQYYFRAQMPAGESFTNCVHCGQCEEKCPQHLPISDALHKVGEVFGQ
ncbi:aldo/keto reductase [Deltaproteobacteria bacterium OttesenSCG-928-M10]|nr:aldo/keto reductase [Deltaproteobacteria bacterium OttesenSCG-928-M10]